MHEKIIRFKIVKRNYIFEAILDDRLSFSENFKLLENIMDIDIKNSRVYDPYKKVFLDNNAPLSAYNISNIMLFYLF